MSELEVVALLSADLMFGSRLQAALQPEGIAVATTRVEDMLPETSLIFVDLNSDPGTRLEAISRLRERRPEVTLVAFCEHGEKELRRQAMAAGADHVVANRHLPEAARRLAAASDLLDLGDDDDR